MVGFDPLDICKSLLLISIGAEPHASLVPYPTNANETV